MWHGVVDRDRDSVAQSTNSSTSHLPATVPAEVMRLIMCCSVIIQAVHDVWMRVSSKSEVSFVCYTQIPVLLF